jgi:hypothetical protein
MISIQAFMIGFVTVIFTAATVIEASEDKPIPAWLVKLLKIPEEEEECSKHF